MSWKITERDLDHIIPTVQMLLRRGALAQNVDPQMPRNFYDSNTPSLLSERSLDSVTLDSGNFLIKKYVCQNSLMGTTAENCPSLETVSAPKELLTKIRSGKSVTVKRMSGKTPALLSAHDQVEKERSKKVKKQTKAFDRLLLANNTCQALIRPIKCWD